MFLWREGWSDDEEGQRDKTGQGVGKGESVCLCAGGEVSLSNMVSPTMNIYIESSELCKLKTKL